MNETSKTEPSAPLGANQPKIQKSVAVQIVIPLVSIIVGLVTAIVLLVVTALVTQGIGAAAVLPFAPVVAIAAAIGTYKGLSAKYK